METCPFIWGYLLILLCPALFTSKFRPSPAVWSQDQTLTLCRVANSESAEFFVFKSRFQSPVISLQWYKTSYIRTRIRLVILGLFRGLCSFSRRTIFIQFSFLKNQTIPRWMGACLSWHPSKIRLWNETIQPSGKLKRGSRYYIKLLQRPEGVKRQDGR